MSDVPPSYRLRQFAPGDRTLAGLPGDEERVYIVPGRMSVAFYGRMLDVDERMSGAESDRAGYEAMCEGLALVHEVLERKNKDVPKIDADLWASEDVLEFFAFCTGGERVAEAIAKAITDEAAPPSVDGGDPLEIQSSSETPSSTSPSPSEEPTNGRADTGTSSTSEPSPSTSRISSAA